LAAFIGFTSDEANELRHAFLDCFFGIIRDFPMWGQHLAHDPDNIGYWHEPVLLPYSTFTNVISGCMKLVGGAVVDLS
jgi:hypothetical protein